MKETIFKCDGCGTTRNVVEYKIDCGSEMDPSGNSYNVLWEQKDFCFKCLKKYVLCKNIDISRIY